MTATIHALDAHGLKRALERAADLILSETEALTRADQAIGDGDHGIGMARGFTAVKEGLENGGTTIPEVLAFVGKTLMLKVGGSSGALFGTMFLSGAKALDASPLDAPLDAENFARFLEAGLDAVRKRGGAKVGDKTLVDALAPAAAAARAAAASSLPDCLRAAAEAAREGMERTRGMIATLGRAKTLGERSLGHPDPGAMSMAFLLRGLAA